MSTPRDLKELGATLVLANAYHLYLRPGAERVARLGGLHAFMGWDGPLLTDSGYSLSQIGVITGVAGATAGVLGSFVGGAALLRLGHRQALLGFGVLQALGLAAYLPVVGGLHDLAALSALVYFEQFVDGLSTVALFTLMMDHCREPSAGTDYSLQASLMMTVTGLAALGGGVFTDLFGYVAVFATAALITLLSLVPAVLFFRTAGRGEAAV